MRPVKIFIASPSDVSEERQLACRAILRLQKEFADRIEVQLVMWEQEPLLATADFQSQIGAPSDSDIFILIMWSRFGSPLGDDFRRADGSRYASASEFEFEQARQTHQETGFPQILTYRKSAPVDLKDDASRSQMDALNDFFQKWFVNEDNTASGAYHGFVSPVQFEDLLELHLRKLLIDFLPRPNNLPSAMSAFVGRDKLVDKLQGLLLSRETRLVVLAGPGGTGKTRLSLQLGHQLLKSFKDGVFFVSLASVTDPEMVPTSIANAVDANLTTEPGVAGIIRELKRKQLLLIIDNLEQVQSAGKYISTILAECSEVKAIVTSREALKASGAQIVRVPPLELPDVLNLPPLHELEQFEAVRLFVSRAKAVREEFELNDENARHVVEICKRVDALPLAIELAASRIRSMNPARLSQVLDQRFKLLTGGADDLLAHQRSLRELIAWSYDLLEEPEQRLWRRLAVFADGCDIPDAQEVCDPDDEFFLEVDFEPLVDKSLVNVDLNGEVPRVVMLESLRAFVREKLEASDEFVTVQRQFCDWCADLGFIDEDTATGAGFEAILERVEKEQNNLRSALEYHISDNNAEAALHLCGSLYQYWYTRGLVNEGVQWIERALAVGTEAGSLVRGRALKGLATLLRGQGRLEEARQHATDALEIFESVSHPGMRATVLCELAAIAQREGKLDKATELLDDCISTARSTSVSDASMAWFLVVQGVCEHLSGNLVAARELYTEGLALSRDAGDKTRTATALLNLGEILEDEGDVDGAYTHYRDSLALWIALKHKQAVARCAEMIAGLEVNARVQPYEAAFLFGAAEAIREDIEEPVESYNQASFDSNVAATRAAMSPEVFDVAWQNGRGLMVEGVYRHVIGGQSESA